MRTKTPYPPCILNPNTEKPFPRHEWEIPDGADVVEKRSRLGEPIYYYRVRCSRCGLNDPKPPLH